MNYKTLEVYIISHEAIIKKPILSIHVMNAQGCAIQGSSR
jgi:hypothetical protein